MEKAEKTKRTREKILQAALIEFGDKSYDVASINTICSENKISKGLIYHNFKNKDELYLACVTMCYDAMVLHLQNTICDASDTQAKLKQLLSARQVFFENNPHYYQIFFNSMLNPPNHLTKELKQVRSDYHECLRKRYIELLTKMKLRKNVSIEKALTYLMFFQEMYNQHFRELYDENADMYAVIQTHETNLSELLDILFYGIANPSQTAKQEDVL